MNEKFINALMKGTQAELEEALGNAGECYTVAEDWDTQDHYKREAAMIGAIGRYRFPATWGMFMEELP